MIRIKNFFFFTAIMCSAWFCGYGQSLPMELLRPEVVSIGRMPMRSTSFGFERDDLAGMNDRSKSEFFLSLNGTWKFNWVKSPKERPLDFYRNDFNDQSWNDFKVPANWELNGYGTPIYVNQPYEFAGHAKRYGKLNPPFDIPEDNNPVGSYRKKVTIPESWKNREVFIQLGAVKSAYFIWVNGQQVGYSEDSKLPSEFDITKFVHPGENVIALQVYRFSDASYVECQDMWRISGIERDVFLYSTPKIDIRDFKISANLDKNYTNGQLKVEAEIASYKIDQHTLHSKADTFSVEAELIDPAGLSVWKDQSKLSTVLGNYHSNLSFSTTISNVKNWSAETPTLYTLLLRLKNKSNQVIQVIPTKVGFRTIELVDRNFLVNGKRVFLKGVNRHEHHPTQGHTLTREEMRKDLEMMKKLNVNAVRQSHYPPDPYWLDLCDQYGIYVVDEANIESHGRGYDLSETLGNDKQWRNVHMERVTRMYERDKNHPSIVTWSLGNEAGNGCNFYEAYDWLKKSDSRPVQYERAEMDYNTDMIVPQYPDPDWLTKYAAHNPSRPLIMSEYAHIMGNSLGNFKEYWDNIEKLPYEQGGFIWEWIDQAIDTVKNGKRIMAYGGDFPFNQPVDENLSDNDFCVKGVVTAYRKMTPMAVEVKKVYQSIKTSFSGSNQLTVRNGYFFRDLSNVRLCWTLLENGLTKERGVVDQLNVPAQEEMKIELAIKSQLSPLKEYHLNVSYQLKSAEPFLPVGHELAYDQFVIREKANNEVVPASGVVKVAEKDGKYVVSAKAATLEFDLNQGVLTCYRLGGEKILENGPKPAFWRAPTDNDIGARFNESMRIWRNAWDLAGKSESRVELPSADQCKITFVKKVADQTAQVTQTFTIYGDASVRVETEIKPLGGAYKLLMRIGNDLETSQALRQVSWYGRGPGENYWDRKSGSLLGQYHQTIDEQYFQYARPQESGNKSDVRWFELSDSKGKGVRFEYESGYLNCSILPYSLDQLDPEQEKRQYHSGELESQNKGFAHVDYLQTGVQGIDSWGAWPMKKYRIPYQQQKYSYWIKPLKK